jgi:hypothetical protein
MERLLVAVILFLLVIVLFQQSEYFSTTTKDTEKVQPVDMIAFKSEDPIKTKYTKNWDYDAGGLNSSDKYYENLVYYNTGLSDFDPAGDGMFNAVGALGYEVLGNQVMKNGGDVDTMKFGAPMMLDSMEDNV